MAPGDQQLSLDADASCTAATPVATAWSCTYRDSASQFSVTVKLKADADASGNATQTFLIDSATDPSGAALKGVSQSDGPNGGGSVWCFGGGIGDCDSGGF